VLPNRLLAALPPAEYEHLLPSLRTIPLKMRQVLHKHGERVKGIVFPAPGTVVSIASVLEDGHLVEVATVGSEGLVGVSACLGGEFELGEAIVQIPDGGAHVMSLTAFAHEMERRGALHDVTRRYAEAFMGMVMQSSACCCRHSVEERCCRWLLMTHDRARSDEFPLTQELVAAALGVRRPTITLVLRDLRHAGWIEYGRGRLHVLNRRALERRSCECYGQLRAQFGRLLPKPRA
jgi:hypothetical protein